MRYLVLWFFLIILHACVYHDRDEVLTMPITDVELFTETSATGYTYYRDGQTLSPAGGSPHGSFKLRFNRIAASVLNEEGELPEGLEFPPGSVIVKDIYNQAGTLNVSAVMKKNISDPNANSGWIWAEYRPDGGLHYSLEKKGTVCLNCHKGTPNRDFVLTFDLH